MKKVRPQGFTLIELMITLIIIGVVLSLGVMTLRGYIPKQRLLTSISAIENLMQRAQSEANARSYWTCIQFTKTDGILSGTIYADDDGDHNSVNTASACTDDLQISVTQLKSDIDFPSGTGCSNNINQNCIIWFDTTGSPKLCPSSGGNCGQTAVGTCTDATFQVVLANAKLDSTAKAREVEAIAGGLVQLVKPGNKGLDEGLWALAPGLTGTNACE